MGVNSCSYLDSGTFLPQSNPKQEILSLLYSYPLQSPFLLSSLPFTIHNRSR